MTIVRFRTAEYETDGLLLAANPQFLGLRREMSWRDCCWAYYGEFETPMPGRMTFITVLVGASLAFGITTSAEKKPAWQRYLDVTTKHETGSESCPRSYAEIAPEHLHDRGRACLAHLAIQAAKSHDDDFAFRLALVAQCDDPDGVQSLAEAGHELVAEYLRTK